jgi:hypothetical protein
LDDLLPEPDPLVPPCDLPGATSILRDWAEEHPVAVAKLAEDFGDLNVAAESRNLRGALEALARARLLVPEPPAHVLNSLLELAQMIENEYLADEVRAAVRTRELWGELAGRAYSCATALPDAGENGDPDPLVTLDQASALARLPKRTAERLLAHEEFPEPDLRGGGGKSNRWRWSRLRPALQRHARVAELPERFPG